jgi:hypothetical protein
MIDLGITAARPTGDGITLVLFECTCAAFVCDDDALWRMYRRKSPMLLVRTGCTRKPKHYFTDVPLVA